MSVTSPRSWPQLAGRLLARLLALALAASVVGALVVVVVLPRATQGAALTVLTGSMTPEIPVGSVVLVRPVDPRTLEVGDVATYQVREGKETFVTHRIVDVRDADGDLEFVFKGDANPGEDVKPVPSGAVRGEVWFQVPYLGAVRDGLHGKGGVALLGMLILAGYAITQLSGGLKDRKKAKQEGEDDALTPHAWDCDVVVGTCAGDTMSRDQMLSVARGWPGLLLGDEVQGFVLLVAPQAHAREATVEAMRSQGFTTVHAVTSISVATGEPADPEALPGASLMEGSHATS